MKKYLPYVNIKMGTKSHTRCSYGNTLPLTQLPFGMASFCLQTDSRGCWFYHPDHEFTEGVRLTHQPSPWIGDYGSFVMIPQNDSVSKKAPWAWSGYRPEKSVQSPDYLKLTFLRSNAEFELTPTERGGAVRVTFLDERDSYLSFLPVKGNYTYILDPETDTLIGTTDGHSIDDAKDFKMYFAVKFLHGCADFERSYPSDERGEIGMHIFAKARVMDIRIGISYISEELARGAIERECGDKSFETLRAEAEEIWEERLSRIEIEAEDDEQMRTFYSCLYRTFLFPHKAYELDKDNKALHYSPKSGEMRPGVRYTDNGFWDTYRTVYPLFTLIARDEFSEMLSGFVNDYRECGWLPRWPSIGEFGCMPSTLIDAVIAEAAVNGIGSRETLEGALEGMLHHANNESADRRYGRNGALSYLKYGYVPRDEHGESVNLTLDAAYGDFCIATVARMLGRDELVPEYMARSKNYKNLFDAESGFMRGKDKDGRMADSFDPIARGGEYTEGSAWQNSFAVPHDIDGLATLYGGRDKLVAKLDELFATPPLYHVGGYRQEIHEMTEMAAADFGQMAISNQPSFHIPFLFAALGAQEKTDYWVERIAREAFNSGNAGYPGDEDNGSMSAWYIFACLGMYRLCPGKSEWVKCKRLVKSAKILGKEI